jgi:monoamine oxidase
MDGWIHKIAVEYATPFWEKKKICTLFSHASIAQEMYDHSTFDNTGFALKVFWMEDPIH